MKIYFAGSIKGGREKQQEYFELIKYINQYGKVLTEHVGNVDVDVKSDILYSNKKDEHVYIRDTKWIDECDIVIAEVSIPSLGVGYELGYAESKGKKIICLYDNNALKSLSFMISGNCKNKIISYNNLEEVKEELKKYFKNNE